MVPRGEEGQLLLPLAVGPAHVGQQDHGGVVVQQVADGGQGGDDTGVVMDHARGLIMGNVEVTAQEDLLSGHVNVADGLLIIIHRNNAPSFHIL